MALLRSSLARGPPDEGILPSVDDQRRHSKLRQRFRAARLGHDGTGLPNGPLRVIRPIESS